MKLLYGTGNTAKLGAMRRALAPLGITLLGLVDMPGTPPQVPEDGNSPLENARIKAQAYFTTYGQPVFSCDSGLYIEGLDDAQQPGVHVRNVKGEYLNDERMIEYYAGIARRLGGQCLAQYINAICLVKADGSVTEHMGPDISSNKFMLAQVPHQRREAGFPLDSLSLEIKSGRYYYDLQAHEAVQSDEGFRRFFEQALAIGR